jgi:hypothetical protein
MYVGSLKDGCLGPRAGTDLHRVFRVAAVLHGCARHVGRCSEGAGGAVGVLQRQTRPGNHRGAIVQQKAMLSTACCQSHLKGL